MEMWAELYGNLCMRCSFGQCVCVSEIVKEGGKEGGRDRHFGSCVWRAITQLHKLRDSHRVRNVGWVCFG